MHPFGTQLLRAHYAATGWDPDNDYSQLTKPTQALLDLSFVPGLHFTLGKFPAQQFSNSAALSVLSPPSNIPLDQRISPHSLPYPTLTGSVSYVTSNVQSFQFIPTRSVPLTTIVDRFAVPIPPRNKSLDSQNSPVNDYLLYGRFHLPTYRLDALYSRKFSPTLQALVTLVSIPSSMTTGLTSSSNYPNQENSPTNYFNSNGVFGGPSIWNLMVSVNHDTGKWSQQYNYSTEDGLFGARVLHNFPTTKRRGSCNNNGSANPFSHLATFDDELSQSTKSNDRKKLVDEDEVMDNVLKGRFSMGGELYFSAQKKSAGVSTGIRFCTIPDPPGSVLTQQPTVISATLNPIMGQISTSYGTKIGPNLALATRFDFNLFSFDSDITFGLEWLQKKRKIRVSEINEDKYNKLEETELLDLIKKDARNERIGLGSNVLHELDPEHNPNSNLKNSFTSANHNNHLINYFWRTVSGFEDTLSILKARVSPVTGLTLMWEGRWKECLIGIGIQSEFLVSSRQTPTTSYLSPGIGSSNFSKNESNDNMNNNVLLTSNHDSCQSPLIKGICLQLQYTN